MRSNSLHCFFSFRNFGHYNADDPVDDIMENMLLILLTALFHSSVNRVNIFEYFTNEYEMCENKKKENMHIRLPYEII